MPVVSSFVFKPLHANHLHFIAAARVAAKIFNCPYTVLFQEAEKHLSVMVN